MSIEKDDLDDLKQFISVTLGQKLAMQKNEIVDELRDEIDKNITMVDKRFSEQDQKLDEILNAVGSNLEDFQEAVKDNETRIKRLEKKYA